MSNHKLAWLGAAACLALAVSDCTAGHGPGIHDGAPVPGAAGHVVSLDQGWSEAEQTFFWYGSQGSRILPYDWFLALEQTSNGQTRAFASRESLGRFRFLLSQPASGSPDGLPVGFARDRDRTTGQSWVGWSCAACHTGQIEYQGTTLRIDGGPMIADLTTFQYELVRTMRQTNADDGKFDRFAHEILGGGCDKASAESLRHELIAQTDALAKRFTVDTPPHPYGNGRLDAFGAISNQVLGTDLKEPANYQLADAPVSVPFLWDTPDLDRVQWNGIAPNSGSGPLARDLGEILGVFGTLEIKAGQTRYPSSANLPSLEKLEETLKHLRSPQWPRQVLPAIDTVKVKRGGALYRQHCAGCHALIPRTHPHPVNVVMTPVLDIGTDPRMAHNAATRTAKSGILQGSKAYVLTGEPLGATAPATDLIDHVIVGAMLAQPLKSAAATIEDFENVKLQLPKAREAYKARPLDGIWATAPYLHNGSVPNLWQLLQPEDQRIKSFYIGLTFDPVNVGFDTAPSTGSFEFDATLPGNSNAGHPYGTKLTDAEKWELIEFLKSL
jgi:mono/diheme cytochrome c family protein